MFFKPQNFFYIYSYGKKCESSDFLFFKDVIAFRKYPFLSPKVEIGPSRFKTDLSPYLMGDMHIMQFICGRYFCNIPIELDLSVNRPSLATTLPFHIKGRLRPIY